jgi:hypothetical protein
MTDEKWEEITGRIKDQFVVESEFDEPQEQSPGRCRGIIFQGPSGKMKLEYTTTPVVIGTRGMGSKRIGSTTTVRYEYSPDETRAALAAYRWEHDEWVPMSAETLLAE